MNLCRLKSYIILGDKMRVRYRDVDVDALGRIMRAEAVGEGVLGMKLVGNVVVNRVVYSCQPFKKIDTVYKAVMQKNQFEGTTIKLFTSQATSKERKLAMDCIKFWRGDPATRALYFQNPGKGKSCKTDWYGVLAGRFRNHCFYNPEDLCNL